MTPASLSTARLSELTRLAADIIQSVDEDRVMPHGLAEYAMSYLPGASKVYDKDDVESLLLEMAQVITEIERRGVMAIDYIRHYMGDTQHTSNADEILVGNMDGDGNWIKR
jgi:hypothetical protein